MKRGRKGHDANSSPDDVGDIAKKQGNTAEECFENTESHDWGNLLPDIILQIFKYLPLLDRAHASQVCRNWNHVFHMPDLWRCFEFELNQPATSYLKATHPDLIKQIIKRHSTHLQYVSFKVDSSKESAEAACDILSQLVNCSLKTLGLISTARPSFMDLPKSHFISALTVVFVNSKSLSSLKIDDTPVDDPSLKVLVANNSDTLRLLKMSSCPHVSPAGTRSVNRRRRQNSMEKWAALVWALCILGQETWASQRKPPLSVGSSTSPLFEEGPSAGIMTEGNAGFLITDRHVLHHTIITDLNPAFVFNKMATEVNMPLEVQNRFNISVVRAQVSMKHMLRQLEKTFIPPPTPRGGRKKRFIGFLLSSLIMAVVGAVANSVVSTVNVVSIGTLHSRMKELETELDDLNSKLDEYLQGMQNATSTLKETTITVNAHSQLHAHSIELLRRFQEERDFQKKFQEPWRHVVNTLLLEAQDTINALIRGRIPLYVVPFETVKGVLSKANVGEVSDVQVKMAFELGTALCMYVNVELMRVGFLLNLPLVGHKNVYQIRTVHNVGTWVHGHRWMVKTPDLVAYQDWEAGPMLVPDLSVCKLFQSNHYICRGKPFLPNATQILCGVLPGDHGHVCPTVVSQPPAEEQTMAVLVGTQWLVSSPVKEAMISYPQHGTHTQVVYPYPVTLVSVPKGAIVTVGDKTLFHVSEEVDHIGIEPIDTFKGAQIPIDPDLEFLLQHKTNHTVHLEFTQGQVKVKDLRLSRGDRDLWEQHTWSTPQNILHLTLKVFLLLWIIALTIMVILQAKKVEKLMKSGKPPDYGVVPLRVTKAQA